MDLLTKAWTGSPKTTRTSRSLLWIVIMAMPKATTALYSKSRKRSLFCSITMCKYPLIGLNPYNWPFVMIHYWWRRSQKSWICIGQPTLNMLELPVDFWTNWDTPFAKAVFSIRSKKTSVSTIKIQRYFGPVVPVSV